MSLRGEHIKNKRTLISIKNNVNFEIIFLHVTGYSNTKESFPSCMFEVMVSGKCELHTYFTFLQRIITSTHMKKFNIFLHNICRDDQHSLSGLDNVKMTCITHKFPWKLLLGKDVYTLTFVDLETETSISIWEFEKMNVLK